MYNYRKIDKFDQFKKKKSGNFLRSFFLNYIIHVISNFEVEKLLLPGILDQIKLKRREHCLLFSTMPDYWYTAICNLFPISYEHDFSK